MATLPASLPFTLGSDSSDIDIQFAPPMSLKEKLTQSDKRTAMSTADMMAAVEQAGPGEVTVTLYDKVYEERGPVQDYLNLRCDFPRHNVETGMLTMKGEDPLAEAALLCHDEVVPITIEVGNLLWSGRIKIAKDRFGWPNEADTVVCELEGDRAWLMKILAWPNYLLPIQVQFPPRGVAIGTADSVIRWLIKTQTFRIQSGYMDVLNNALSLNLDWRSWMGKFLMTPEALGDNGFLDLGDVMRMLRTPMYVMRGNWFKDTTPLISVNYRMDKVFDIIDQIVKDNGLTVTVKLWRPGDPQPDEDMAFPLTVPTLVVDVKDHMGIVGATGTFFDGILRTLVDLQDSIFGEITKPFLNPKGRRIPEGFNIAPALGLNWIEPWVIFNADHKDGGVWGEIDHHHPLARRVVIGGRSPQWMNRLMNATWAWLVDMLMIVVGLAGVPSNLFEGLFNNVLLAFALADNMDRWIKAGPYAYPEYFAALEHSPYNVDGIFAMKREMFNTRGYVSGIVYFDDGYPYSVGRDLHVGALASIIRRSKVYTDFIENIAIEDDRTKLKVEVQIGDGKAEEPTVVKTYRNIVKFQEALNAIMLSTWQ